MMRSGSLLLLAALTVACANPGEAELESQVRLDWENGQTFHVSSMRREVANKTPLSTLDLDGNTPADHAMEPAWGPEAVWRYQVIEKDLIVEAGDELHEYAVDALGRVQPITVIRADLDPTVNEDESLASTDPVHYLVFRADRDRLAAIVSFHNVDGERIESAVSTHELDGSISSLSQSNLADLPTYLAPFSAKYIDAEAILEDGSTMTSAMGSMGEVDVSYNDVVGGGAVTSTYAPGEPWPLETFATDSQSRLLSGEEVNERRMLRGTLGQLPPPPEDFDYRAALRASIDLDQSLTLDEETINGGWSEGVYEEYTPWPGNWWPLSTAKLVYGYDDRETFSGLIFETVKPLASRKDEIQEELRDMDDDAPEREELIKEYREKNSELVDELVKFYDGIRDGLDGGQIVIEDGQISHTEDGWSYAINELSPFDKFGVVEYLRDANINNPFYLSAWELLNQYNPVGGSWWGHCNGWAAAAIATHEPMEPVEITEDGTTIEFTTADLKGLLTASYYSGRSHFYGARYDGKDDQDIADLHPDAFHKIVDFYLRRQKVPFVFDTTAGDAVWNYPAYSVDMDVEEMTPEGALELININTATIEELDALWRVGPTTAEAIVDYRMRFGPFQSIEDFVKVNGIGSATLEENRDKITVKPVERTFDVMASVRLQDDGVSETYLSSMGDASFVKNWGYTLYTDVNGKVLRGEWNDDNEHPDFAWVPFENPRVRAQGGSENPFLEYNAILNVFGEDIERR